jgi:hypothetical protein
VRFCILLNPCSLAYLLIATTKLASSRKASL